MYVPKEERKQIIAALHAAKGDIAVVAAILHIPPARVKWVETVVNNKFGIDIEKLPRPELYPYIIAVRDNNSCRGWGAKDPTIMEARKMYNEGLVEITSMYHENLVVLYAIPRREKAMRQDFFRVGQ